MIKNNVKKLIKKIKTDKKFRVKIILALILCNIIYTAYMYYPNIMMNIKGDEEERTIYADVGSSLIGPNRKCRYNVTWDVSKSVKMDQIYYFVISCYDKEEALYLKERLELRKIPVDWYDDRYLNYYIFVKTTPRVLKHAWLFNPLYKYYISIDYRILVPGAE